MEATGRAGFSDREWGIEFVDDKQYWDRLVYGCHGRLRIPSEPHRRL